MPDLLASVRKFLLHVAFLGIGAVGSIVVFEQVIAAPAKLPLWVTQSIQTAIIIVAGAILATLIRRFRSTLVIHAGPHPAGIFSFFMMIVIILAVIFGILHTFQVPSTTLLLGGGVITILVGLLVSTVVANVLSGALMLTSYPFRVGDSVLVDNVPAVIEDVGALFTRIRNDAGSETVIPNSAIMQGVVRMTKMPSGSASAQARLPYAVGDRVYTTYVGGEGVVTEITVFYTKVLLDGGKEVTIPNTSVLTGAIQFAKVRRDTDTILNFAFKLNWDAEKAIRAMADVARTDPATFKSPPRVHFSSIEGQLVELRVVCQVDPAKKDEAKTTLLRAAYLVRY